MKSQIKNSHKNSHDKSSPCITTSRIYIFNLRTFVDNIITHMSSQ